MVMLVLIVEDDAIMREAIRDILKLAGYGVIEADSGKAALQAIESMRPDLIISDIMMPGMDGYDFYRRVQADGRWKDVPFVFLTARYQKADIKRGQALGVDAYVTKPFAMDDLLAVVAGQLGKG
jgi:CheY-like chemotaxis protein